MKLKSGGHRVVSPNGPSSSRVNASMAPNSTLRSIHSIKVNWFVSEKVQTHLHEVE